MEVGEKVQMVGEATLFLSHPTSREARQLAGTSEESMLVLGVVVLHVGFLTSRAETREIGMIVINKSACPSVGSIVGTRY